MFVGVDGCPDGWVAVRYGDGGYAGAGLYSDIEDLWATHGDTAQQVLIDVPIGLREDSSKKRVCDDVARQVLSPTRHSSVFPVPVRAAVHAESYEAAKAIQEERTDGSLGVQSWNIADNIAELDTFLRETAPEAVGTVREAHPEVCFWALNDRSPTGYSKTGQGAAAFWERIDILEHADEEVLTHVRDAGSGLDAGVDNDDILDAFVLALTAHPGTGDLRTLPGEPPIDERGLPMEMVHTDPG
jgi:predicted RNase H-like nuclease